MTQSQLGFLRAIGLAVLYAVLVFVGNEANLTGILNPNTAMAVSAFALWLDHMLTQKTGSSVFGRVA